MCGMEPNDTDLHVDRHLREGLIRAVCCLAVGVVGFWYPVFSSYLRSDPDSRVGLVFLFSFTFIPATAYWASDSLYQAYRGAEHNARARRLAVLVCLGCLCWLPTIAWCSLAIVKLVLSYVR
jgi:hypothetical protein